MGLPATHPAAVLGHTTTHRDLATALPRLGMLRRWHSCRQRLAAVTAATAAPPCHDPSTQQHRAAAPMASTMTANPTIRPSQCRTDRHLPAWKRPQAPRSPLPAQGLGQGITVARPLFALDLGLPLRALDLGLSLRALDLGLAHALDLAPAVRAQDLVHRTPARLRRRSPSPMPTLLHCL